MPSRILIPWARFPPFGDRGIDGVSVVLWELTCELVKEGAKVDVLVPADNETEQSVEGVSVLGTRLGKKIIADEQLSREKRSFLDNYDCVLSIQNVAAGSLFNSVDSNRLARQIHNVISATSLKHALTLDPSLVERLKTNALRRKFRADEIKLKGSRTICASKFLMDLMMKHNLEDVGNLLKIANGVDTLSFRHKYCEKKYDVLFIGNFYWVKGLDILFQALHALNGLSIYLKVAIAGYFTKHQKLYLLALAGKQQKSKVVFLDVVQRVDLPDVINASKIVVIPSRYETFGIVALESTACGVPVVASKVGGLPEILDETTARFVPPGEPVSLANMIRSTVTDNRFEESCITNGPEKAKNYDWSVIGRKTFEALLR
jgi:glycosyltransferase involved in cell wall biosynthesis